jgi:DNA repair protein RAD5
MGKTIMMSALIQTNRCPDGEDDQEMDGNKRSRQLKLNSSFRAMKPPSKPTKPPSATLIVAPTSLLSQWSDEIHRSSNAGTAKMLIWHGQNRQDLEAAIEDDDDDDETIKVVITSYGVLASEHAKSEKSTANRSPIFESLFLYCFWHVKITERTHYPVEWLRVVCDEAHHCKSRSSKTARAVYALRARTRWAVTGQ